MPRSKGRRAKDRRRLGEERAIARVALARKQDLEKLRKARTRTVRQDE